MIPPATRFLKRIKPPRCHVVWLLIAWALVLTACHGNSLGQALQPLVTAPTNDPWGRQEAIDDDALDPPTVEGIPSETSTDAIRSSESWEAIGDRFNVGYDSAFVIAGYDRAAGADEQAPFKLRINGWGQLRHTVSSRPDGSRNVNQFQLKRARLIFSGSAFTNDFSYYIQLDGRSTSGDDVRLLDYYLAYDIGHSDWGLDTGVFGIRTGRFKMPFHRARAISGREFEFTDRSMASTFFDVNRSLAFGAFGRMDRGRFPVHWETALFNGLVTGGAETGSSGNLDTNFAYSGRLHCNPDGNWGTMEMADWDWHPCLSTRFGLGFANSTIHRDGATEFNTIRVVDSGLQLSGLLPGSVSEYEVSLYSVDSAFKYRGWSGTIEYYFRSIQSIQGADLPDLMDQGLWLQLGKFVVPQKLEMAARWSRVAGDSGTLGLGRQSSDELSGVLTYYFRKQNVRFTVDITRLDGAPINSAALDISPGDEGWLFRSQIQFAF